MEAGHETSDDPKGGHAEVSHMSLGDPLGGHEGDDSFAFDPERGHKEAACGSCQGRLDAQSTASWLAEGPCAAVTCCPWEWWAVKVHQRVAPGDCPESGTSKQAWWLHDRGQLDHQELHDYSEGAHLAPCTVWARLGVGTELGRLDEAAAEERIRNHLGDELRSCCLEPQAWRPNGSCDCLFS